MSMSMADNSTLTQYFSSLLETVTLRLKRLGVQLDSRRKLKSELIGELKAKFPVADQQVSVCDFWNRVSNDVLIVSIVLLNRCQNELKLKSVSLICDRISDLNYEIEIFQTSGSQLHRLNCTDALIRDKDDITITVRVKSDYFTDNLCYQLYGFIVFENDLQIGIDEFSVSWKDFLNVDFKYNEILNGKEEVLALLSSYKRTETYFENQNQECLEDRLLKFDFKKTRFSNYFLFHKDAISEFVPNNVIVEVQSGENKLIIYSKNDHQMKLFYNFYNEIRPTCKISFHDRRHTDVAEDQSLDENVETLIHEQINLIETFLSTCPTKNDQFHLSSSTDLNRLKQFQKELIAVQFKMDSLLNQSNWD